MICLCHPLLIPHFYVPLELYVYITLTNNYLAFFHIPVNYLVDNINKLTQMAVIAIYPNTTRLYWFFTEGT